MKYKTEMHCHSAPVSRCALHKPKEIVEQYLDYGYSTVVMTDHLADSTFSHMEDKSILEKIEYFLSGYREVKKAAGDRLNVLLGAEIRYPNTGGTDYLVYGGNEEFYLNNPDMYLHEKWWMGGLVKNNGLLIFQAHPFRFNVSLCPPECIQGIEVYNGHSGQKNHNRMARHWMEEYPEFIGISGTDHHDPWHFPDAGILTDEPIKTNEMLLDVLRNRRFEIICDEETRNKAREEAKKY